MAEAQIITIDKFLGVNRSETETLLQLGEASKMSNWMITDDNKLRKQFGYHHLNEAATSKKICGMWYGNISGENHFIFARGGHVYELDLETGAETDLGTIEESYPTVFFVTNNVVYIIDGDDMYQWDGEGNIERVSGYVPTVFTAAPPTGGGTILEGINYLTGQKTMKFSADGVAKIYQLNELNIDSVDLVMVGASQKTEGEDYTVNKANGTVEFVEEPDQGVNNVVITWTKTEEGDREKITKCQYYGGVYYARFWLFGNPDHKNTRFCSGVTMAGVSDPTYWPKYSESDVGEYEISDIKTQYNRQLIWTTGDSSEASAWYSYEETFTDPYTDILTTIFPVFPMNAKVGNVAKGQVQLIINNPFSLWKGIYEWVSTSVIDEKNAVWVSKRIQNDLDKQDLTKALTVDWSDRGIYYVCIGKRIWALNYRVDAWYIIDLAHTPTCFTLVESGLYFGTEDGQIMKFSDDDMTFDGDDIEAVWEMGFHNFGVDWIRKFINRIFISLLPMTKTHVKISYQTDRSASSNVYTASYGISTFDNMDFANFSFKTNYSPQPFKFKIRAKKIDYFKIVLENKNDDSATILSITLPVRSGGEVRQRV